MDFVSKKFSFNDGDPCVLIGEIGVNHNNDRSLLFELIDKGVEAGVDIIKLQRFKAEEEISTFAPTAEYQEKAGEGDSQLEMARKLELSDEWLVEAFNYCKEKGVGFLCTAFDFGSVDFISDTLGCSSVKVPSPEITNMPLIKYMAKKFNSLIVSTGASDMKEVAQVLQWIREVGDREVALMHCTSEYPAPLNQSNLRAIKTLRDAFDIPVGYSDHTEGVVAGVVTVALGGTMIEKHYTLDKKLKGPDHKASADIKELTSLSKSLKNAFFSLGDGVKKPVESEIKNLPLIRKSITINTTSLISGTVITEKMLSFKRPLVEGAIEPFDLEKVVGMKINKDKNYDEPLLWEDLK